MMFGPMRMMGGQFGGFPIPPVLLLIGLIVLIVIVLRLLNIGRHSRGRRRIQSNRTVESIGARKAELPEDLKSKVEQTLDGIDWEIRLLEKQRVLATDRKEKERLKAEIEEKRKMYRSIVDRLG